MNTEHTPIPWAIGEDGDVFNAEQSACIAKVCGAADGIAEAEANAALIVQAVNSHNELVAALETAVNIAPNDMLATVWGNEARAALAKAKGDQL